MLVRTPLRVSIPFWGYHIPHTSADASYDTLSVPVNITGGNKSEWGEREWLVKWNCTVFLVTSSRALHDDMHINGNKRGLPLIRPCIRPLKSKELYDTFNPTDCAVVQSLSAPHVHPSVHYSLLSLVCFPLHITAPTHIFPSLFVSLIIFGIFIGGNNESWGQQQ